MIIEFVLYDMFNKVYFSHGFKLKSQMASTYLLVVSKSMVKPDSIYSLICHKSGVTGSSIEVYANMDLLIESCDNFIETGEEFTWCRHE